MCGAGNSAYFAIIISNGDKHYVFMNYGIKYGLYPLLLKSGNYVAKKELVETKPLITVDENNVHVNVENGYVYVDFYVKDIGYATVMFNGSTDIDIIKSFFENGYKIITIYDLLERIDEYETDS